jgi:hypothetical protein
MNALAVAVSVDGVHISVQTAHYVAYVAHFLDWNSFKLRKVTLGVRHIDAAGADALTSAALKSKFLEPVENKYRIAGKLSAVVTDGAADEGERGPRRIL